MSDSTAPLVYLVDDDEAVRDSLGMLFRSIGLEFAAHASAFDFLEHYDVGRHACLVADIRMPGLSGLELQQRLNEQGTQIPIIFITSHGDVPMAVNAMKSVLPTSFNSRSAIKISSIAFMRSLAELVHAVDKVTGPEAGAAAAAHPPRT